MLVLLDILHMYFSHYGQTAGETQYSIGKRCTDTQLGTSGNMENTIDMVRIMRISGLIKNLLGTSRLGAAGVERSHWIEKPHKIFRLARLWNLGEHSSAILQPSSRCLPPMISSLFFSCKFRQSKGRDTKLRKIQITLEADYHRGPNNRIVNYFEDNFLVLLHEYFELRFLFF